MSMLQGPQGPGTHPATHSLIDPSIDPIQRDAGTWIGYPAMDLTSEIHALRAGFAGKNTRTLPCEPKG